MTPRQPDPVQTFRFESLDALRGCAVLAVMLLHFSERGCQSEDTVLHAHLWPILRHGYLGVQLFFVISGYCIAAAMFASSAKTAPAVHFFRRRFRRIFPPYWASIALAVVLGMGTILLGGRSWNSVFPLTCQDWLLNLMLLQGPFQSPDVQLVYWSLSVEIQFYLVMACCLYFFRWAEFLLIGMSAITVGAYAGFVPCATGTVFRYWPEFAAGIAAFFLITHTHRMSAIPWLLIAASGLAVIIGICYQPVIFLPDGELPGWARGAISVLLGIGLIIVHRYDISLSQSAFGRNLALLGVASYSLYLTHVLVGTRVFNIAGRLTGLQGLWWAVYAVMAFLSSLVAGWLFFRFCEMPWLNASRQTPYRSLSEPAVGSTSKLPALESCVVETPPS